MVQGGLQGKLINSVCLCVYKCVCVSHSKFFYLGCFCFYVFLDLRLPSSTGITQYLWVVVSRNRQLNCCNEIQYYSYNAECMNSHSNYCWPHTHVWAESDCALVSEPPTVKVFHIHIRSTFLVRFRLNGLSTHRPHLKLDYLLIIFSMPQKCVIHFHDRNNNQFPLLYSHSQTELPVSCPVGGCGREAHL